MKGNPIGWFEIYVDDMERARRFYETVLDTSLERLGDPADVGLEMWSFAANMEQFGAGGTLVKADRMRAGGNSVIVYFSCEDCAQEESRVESAGGTVERSKMSIGEYGFVTIAIDTEGNLIGLHSLN